MKQGTVSTEVLRERNTALTQKGSSHQRRNTDNGCQDKEMRGFVAAGSVQSRHVCCLVEILNIAPHLRVAPWNLAFFPSCQPAAFRARFYLRWRFSCEPGIMPETC